MLHLIDSHCHLDFDVFDNDRDSVIQRCTELGVKDIVVPAVSRLGWPKLIEVCAERQMLHPALGLHPMFMQQHQASDIEALEWAINDFQPVAIGEIGLDFFIPEHDPQSQIALFEAQIRLAEHYQLPVILHVRKAHDAVLKVLRQSKVKGGIVHAFNGSLQQAEQYQSLGFLFGVGGALTYPRAQKLRRLFASLPEHSIVLETDSPDMPLSGYQGQRNSPEMIPQVLETLAQIRNCSAATLAAVTTDNCRRIFSLHSS